MGKVSLLIRRWGGGNTSIHSYFLVFWKSSRIGFLDCFRNVNHLSCQIETGLKGFLSVSFSSFNYSF